MAQVVAGNRGGKALISRGYRYTYNQKRLTYIYWRCWREDCPGTLRTNRFDFNNPNAVIQPRNGAPHNHGSDDAYIARNNTVELMKAAIRRDPSRRLRDAYDEIVRQVVQQHGVAAQFPPYESIRSTLNRTRLENIPPVPVNVHHVVLNGVWTVTLGNDRFLLYQDNRNGILVFATDDDIRVLATADCVYVDGTFRSAPRPFLQFFTIHGRVNDFTLKLGCALLANKEARSYRIVLQVIAARVHALAGHAWAPAHIVTDFEAGILAAVRIVLPGARVEGCYFHFAKAIWKHVQTLGLVRAYNRNPRMRLLIRKVVCIGFLPLNLVRMNFQMLRNNAVHLIRIHPALNRFFGYIERTWVNRNARFPPRLWNVFRRQMEFRTNNAVESYNRKWNDIVGVRHPSLFLFIRSLKNQQVIHETEKQNMLNGLPPPLRRRKWRRLEERIDRVKAQYMNGQRTIDNYWNAVTVLVHRYHRP